MKRLHKSLYAVLLPFIVLLFKLVFPQNIFACTITGITSTLNVNEIATGQITSGTPNTNYALATGNANCIITPNIIATDASGNGTQSFNVVCTADGYMSVSAGSGSDFCNFFVTVGTPPPGGQVGPAPNPLNQGGCSGDSLFTAIGCIPIGDTNAFAQYLLRWSMGIAGGVALILIIYAGFLIITSAGNPQRLNSGKELLTSAITGLVLLLFGAFVLNLIGVQILNIPGF